MDTKQMEKSFTEIATQVNNMIPEGWEKVYIYGESIEDVTTVYFYYYTKENGEPIYSQNIPQIFDIDEDEFDNDWLQLADSINELWQEFKNSGEPVWTNLTFILESTGKFKIDYDYTDLSEASPRKQHIIWKYKYLEITPKDEYDKKIIDEYLKSQEK